MTDNKLWYGEIELVGINQEDARWIMTAMESMVEDSEKLKSAGVEQPEKWVIRGPYEEGCRK